MAVSVTPIRDTKWLTLEVCREFQRGTCSRPDTECKFAHPSKSCQVENGRVIACFDSLKVSKYSVLLRICNYWLRGLGTQYRKFGIMDCFVNTLVMQHVLVHVLGWDTQWDVIEPSPAKLTRNFTRPLTPDALISPPRAESVVYWCSSNMMITKCDLCSAMVNVHVQHFHVLE